MQPTHVIVQNTILFLQRHFWFRHGDLYFTLQHATSVYHILYCIVIQYNRWPGKVEKNENFRHRCVERKDYSHPEPQ